MGKNNFLRGAAALGAAGVVVKVLGAFFRIPLGNIIGSQGMGYYQVAYNVFNFLLAFTAAGFPTAVSKLVSEKRAKGNLKGAHKIFKTSFFMLLALGAAASIIMVFISPFLAKTLFKSPHAYYAILALSPTIFFVALLASFRGYFQGMNDMKPTAMSQIVEQIARVTIGIMLAIFFLRYYSIELAAAGGVLGAFAGACMGLLTIVCIYKRKARNIITSTTIRYAEETTTDIIKNIVKMALPIAIGVAVIPVINMLDTVIVLRRLQSIGFTYVEAISLFGQLQGMAMTLINLPQVLTIALAVSLVPVISEASIYNNWEAIQSDTKMALKMAILIGLPASVGLAVLSTPIMALLFPREPSSIGQILLFLSPAVFFLAQLQALTGVLQGLGKPHIPVRNLIVGAAFKVVVTYVLTGIIALNIKGAAIGTVVAYFVAFVLNYYSVKKVTKVKMAYRKIIFKPALAVSVMGIAIFFIYNRLVQIIGNNKATLIAIVCGGLVYLAMLLLTKTLTKEDFELFPGGTRLIKQIERIKMVFKK
ncbi:MAG: putative polysaccharide biosynthesis protein [Alkaliphilus sp.]